jgi:hypothetical protein
MEALLGMDSTPCKDCGEVYVHFDPSVRYHNNGKCMPLDENNQRHDFRDCPKSRFNLSRRSKIRARTATKSELKKIEDHAILSEIHDKVRFWRSRLANYTLDLHIDKKFPEGEGA